MRRFWLWQVPLAPLCKGSWLRSRLRGCIPERNAMRRKHNEELLSFARSLRRNMTAEERKLWYDFLRDYPVPFTRQKILGYYIADFYCAKAKLVVELDGSQHYQNAGQKKDEERSVFLAGYGISVLRIPNNAVHQNFSGVCEAMDLKVKKALEK